jgi:hypothetical protein
MRGERKAHHPPPTHLFSAESYENIWPAPIGRQPRVARTGNLLLLVDRQREPAACFYLSTGREDDADEGHTQDSSPVSGDRTYQIVIVWFLLLDKEPISGSHFSSFLHFLPLKQYKGWFSMKSIKHKLFCRKCLWVSYFYKFLTSLVLQ